MEFINYNKCSTCKNAKKYLDENNIKYIDRGIKEDTPTKEELKGWIAEFNKGFGISIQTRYKSKCYSYWMGRYRYE